VCAQVSLHFAATLRACGVGFSADFILRFLVGCPKRTAIVFFVLSTFLSVSVSTVSAAAYFATMSVIREVELVVEVVPQASRAERFRKHTTNGLRLFRRSTLSYIPVYRLNMHWSLQVGHSNDQRSRPTHGRRGWQVAHNPNCGLVSHQV